MQWLKNSLQQVFFSHLEGSFFKVGENLHCFKLENVQNNFGCIYLLSMFLHGTLRVLTYYSKDYSCIKMFDKLSLV